MLQSGFILAWQPFFRENTYILIKKRLNKRFIAQKEDLRGKRRMSAKKLTTTKKSQAENFSMYYL